MIFGARGIVHIWQCLSENGGKMLVLATSGAGFEQFANEMSRQGIMTEMPVSVGKLMALAARYDLEIHPPVW